MPAYNLCRICLKEDNSKTMQPLFDDSNSKCAEIVQRIEECGGIELKNEDQFPKQICAQCVDSLNTSYKFRELCQASENSLMNTIHKPVMKIEMPDFLSDGEDEHISTDTEHDFLLNMEPEFIDADNRNFSDISLKHEDFSEQELSENSDEQKPIRKKTSRKKSQKEKGSPAKRKTSKRNTQPEEQLVVVTDAEDVKPKRGRKKSSTTNNRMCEICGNIYTKPCLLKMHMLRHADHKPFECEICSKCFATASDIARHMRVHTGEKPYVCKFCGRNFSDRSIKIRHERTHTNERPFACSTCGKAFSYSNVLKNHMLTHTGEKRFPCLPCNKSFSRKHQLDQHIATITHQQTVKILRLNTT